MNKKTPYSNSPLSVETLDQSEVTVSFRRKLKVGEKELDTPTRAIPSSELYHDNQIIDDTRNANEFFKQVDSGDLFKSFENCETAIDGLEQQFRWARDGEVNFTFLEYDSANQLSKIEAQRMVEILDRYSDFFTAPLQPKIWTNIEEDATQEDNWFTQLYNSVDLFLQSCREYNPEQPILGGIPPLEVPLLEKLIELYEQYDVFAFYFDFDWNLPTRTQKIDRVSYFIRRAANQRHHTNVFLYALNARQGTMNPELGFLPAADFAPVYMGFDVVGGSHRGPRIDPDEVGEIDPREEFRLFKRNIVGRIQTTVDDVPDHFPEKSNVDAAELVRRAKSYQTLLRWEKIINSEQMELELRKFREALEKGTVGDYWENRNISPDIREAVQSVRTSYVAGLQREIGEYT